MKIPKLKRKTYSQLILDHMLAGQSISNMEAFAQYGMTCFLQRVSDLRASGVPIQDEFISRNGRCFKRYWIAESDRPTDNEVKK